MPKILCKCGFCGKDLVRKAEMSAYYCDIGCKAKWQKTQRPVSNDWLREKYEREGLDCSQIAKLVNRDPKSVWNWIKDIGIQTRKRGHASTKKFQIGHKLGVGRKHTDETKEKIRQARLTDGRVPCYVNGKHWMHEYTDRKPASWKGGITPERQSFSASPEWKQATKAVRQRDGYKCQICGMPQSGKNRTRFDIHHIISFKNVATRTQIDNLILLCKPCHHWVHSNQNTHKLLIKD